MTEQELKEIKLAWANGETVQYYDYVGGVWVTWESKGHLSLRVSSRWRVEPKTININGHDVPEPLPFRELKRGQEYYVTDLTHRDLAPQLFWRGQDIELLWLERGLCHATKEDAIAHARALLSFTEQTQ